MINVQPKNTYNKRITSLSADEQLDVELFFDYFEADETSALSALFENLNIDQCIEKFNGFLLILDNEHFYLYNKNGLCEKYNISMQEIYNQVIDLYNEYHVENIYWVRSTKINNFVKLYFNGKLNKNINEASGFVKVNISEYK